MLVLGDVPVKIAYVPRMEPSQMGLVFFKRDPRDPPPQPLHVKSQREDVNYEPGRGLSVNTTILGS